MNDFEFNILGIIFAVSLVMTVSLTLPFSFYGIGGLLAVIAYVWWRVTA